MSTAIVTGTRCRDLGAIVDLYGADLMSVVVDTDADHFEYKCVIMTDLETFYTKVKCSGLSPTTAIEIERETCIT